MKKRNIILGLAACLWIIGTHAIAREPIVNQRSRNGCRDAIAAEVSTAQVGEPARAIPRFARRAVTTEIHSAIAQNLTREEAEAVFLEKLARIQNYNWRLDLAQAAAAIVGNPPDACE